MDRPKRTVKLPVNYAEVKPKKKDDSEEEFDDSYETDESEFDESILTDSEELTDDESCNKCK